MAVQKVESPIEIVRRWRREGKTFRRGDASQEWERQAGWKLREIEDLIVATESPGSELRKQVLEHRAAGNWTTNRRDPLPEHPHI